VQTKFFLVLISLLPPCSMPYC